MGSLLCVSLSSTLKGGGGLNGGFFKKSLATSANQPWDLWNPNLSSTSPALNASRVFPWEMKYDCGPTNKDLDDKDPSNGMYLA